MAVLQAPIVLLDQLPQLQQHVQEAFIVLQELKLNCCVHWDNINLFLVKHLVNYVMQDIIVMVLIQLHIKHVQGDIIVHQEQFLALNLLVQLVLMERKLNERSYRIVSIVMLVIIVSSLDKLLKL